MVVRVSKASIVLEYFHNSDSLKVFVNVRVEAGNSVECYLKYEFIPSFGKISEQFCESTHKSYSVFCFGFLERHPVAEIIGMIRTCNVIK